MAFLVGELVANMTINDAPFRRKMRDAHREMDGIASKASRMAKVPFAGIATIAATTTALTATYPQLALAANYCDTIEATPNKGRTRKLNTASPCTVKNATRQTFRL